MAALVGVQAELLLHVGDVLLDMALGRFALIGAPQAERPICRMNVTRS